MDLLTHSSYMKVLSGLLISIGMYVFANPEIIYAKCPYREYVIEGTVFYGDIEHNVASPASNASVAVFLDADNIGCHGLTSKQGRFNIRYWHDTTKPDEPLESCSTKISNVTVIIIPESKEYLPQRTDFKPGNTTNTGPEIVIWSPQIILDWIHPSLLPNAE